MFLASLRLSGLRQLSGTRTFSLAASINVGKEGFLTSEQRDQLCRELSIDKKRICISIEEMREVRKNLPTTSSVGFVPTMGALHQGHLSLIENGVRDNDVTVGSIFVNAAQFAPHEDFSKYPRNPVEDIETMIGKGIDYIFVPTQSDMYPGSTFGQTSTELSTTQVVPKGADFMSEGSARPGFFTGVSTVVSKLFNIVQPTHAYFGQKDGIQVLLVRRMVRDLNFPLKVVPCPTLREPDGLAMSSRNIYLSKEQREIAPVLYKSLQAVEKAFNNGIRSYGSLIDIGLNALSAQNLDGNVFEVQYFSICDAVEGSEFGGENGDTLPDSNIMVSSAINFGNCRILDNVLVGEQL